MRVGVQKRCRYCGSVIEALTVRAASVHRDGVLAVIFRRTIPVLTCPKCDTAPQERKDILWCPTR